MKFPPADRSYEFWEPEAFWPGETVFILGGGPSLTKSAADRLRGRPTIAINSAAYFAPWAPVLFFTDYSWLVGTPEGMPSHVKLVERWPGFVFTVSRRAKRDMPDRVRRLDVLLGAPLGVAAVPMRCGQSSGHTAIALAAAAGANRIVLLGYDMRLVDGRSHAHGDYGHTDEREMIYWRNGFQGWRQAGEDAGLTILNASPGSALDEFERTTIEAELARPRPHRGRAAA